MISRYLEPIIKSKIFKEKAIILLGSRQVGKTTLLKKIVKNLDYLWFNADEPDVISMFENASSSSLKKYFQGYRIVVIDEAQRIHNIGLKLKLITDTMPEVQLLVSGSSAFELANHINEPLTGRKWEYFLYPLSYGELVNHTGLMEEKRLLEHRMVYGSYPEIVTHTTAVKEILKQLTDSYLYKDILIWDRIKKSHKVIKLLQAIAFQIGNQVSYNELAKTVGIDNATVEHYINLLEQAFVIFRLSSFSRNLRTELSKSRKIYFYDNGIRNALIANFKPLPLRLDIGALWENYLVSERIKFNHYHSHWVNRYFWRTRNQQEVDYIEEKDGQLFAYEFKWNPNKVNRITKAFTNHYPDAVCKFITPANMDEFLL